MLYYRLPFLLALGLSSLNAVAQSDAKSFICTLSPDHSLFQVTAREDGKANIKIFWKGDGLLVDKEFQGWTCHTPSKTMTTRCVESSAQDARYITVDLYSNRQEWVGRRNTIEEFTNYTYRMDFVSPDDLNNPFILNYSSSECRFL